MSEPPAAPPPSPCSSPSTCTACTGSIDAQDVVEDESQHVIELAIPLLEEAAGGRVEGNDR